MPAEAVVLETEDGALLAKATLKVLLESEYLSLTEKQSNKDIEAKPEVRDEIKNISQALMKEIILPAITQDINTSPAYAPLRQIYHSLILAEWFKRKSFQQSAVSFQQKQENNNLSADSRKLTADSQSPYASYLNSGTTEGLESTLPWAKQAIWQEYLKSYTDGEYKLQDTLFGLKRIYWSGGVMFNLGGTGASSPITIIPKDTPGALETAKEYLHMPVLEVGRRLLRIAFTRNGGKETSPLSSEITIRNLPEKGSAFFSSFILTLLLAGGLTSDQALTVKQNTQQPITITAEDVLGILADYGNLAALQELAALATQGNQAAADFFKGMSNSAVLSLRSAHLERGVSGRALEELLTEKSLNNPFYLYTAFTSADNFGDLAKMIFARLNAQAKNENIHLLGYLKKLDPQKFFYKDFLLQAANFSLLDDMLSTPNDLRDVLQELFAGLSKEEVISYSTRLALFTEALVNDKSFSLQKDFQAGLRQLYDKTSGINQYLIGSLLYLYRDNLTFLNQEGIRKISKDQGLTADPGLVPYDAIMKDGRIIVHILFADEDALNGHYGPTADFFKQKGYQQTSSAQAGEITLKKGPVEIKLFNVSKGNYDIKDHLSQADIIISRSHAGVELSVFRPKDAAVANGDYQGKILFPSACRSATMLPDILRPYKNAQGIGINTTGYGEQTNIVSYYLIEGLRQGLPKYSDIKNFIWPHLEEGIKDYVFPGDPATTLYKWLRAYQPKSDRSSSPLSAKEDITVTPASSPLGEKPQLASLAEKNNQPGPEKPAVLISLTSNLPLKMIDMFPALIPRI